jgi:hypothetical protein
MNFLWLTTAASLLVALMAWVYARRTAKRLVRLVEMYWELKYQYSELRTQINERTDAAPRTEEPQGPPAAPTAGFVPIASLKR